MFSWGIVGNYTNIEAFVEVLRPFWEDLLSGFDRVGPTAWDGPTPYDAVLVLHQAEDSPALVTQITRANPNRGTDRTLVVKQGACTLGFDREGRSD